MFYSELEKAELCKVIKKVDKDPPRGFVLLVHQSGQHTGGGWAEIYGLRYSMYLIAEDVELVVAVVFVYSDSMQHDV